MEKVKVIRTTECRETEKAVQFPVHTTTTSGGREKIYNMWLPKSLVDEEGFAPSWIILKKIEEAERTRERYMSSLQMGVGAVAEVPVWINKKLKFVGKLGQNLEVTRVCQMN